MFLQLALLAFAVQWIGSPWQFSAAGAVISCAFFIVTIIVSTLPALFREWENIKSALAVYIIIQIVCLVLSVLIPGIGQILAIAFNIYLLLRPVSFYNNIGSGFIFFFLWFLGLNSILSYFILTDPRGIFSGDLYFSAADWVILAVFIAAFVRAVYHLIINFRLSFFKTKTSGADNSSEKITEDILQKSSDDINTVLQKKEITTLAPLLLISVIAAVISLFIQPSWQKQAINDLNAGFTAAENNDFNTAENIAKKYYNEKKILYNGDVFFLNALVSESLSSEEAMQFYVKAASWYDNHKSIINESFPADAYYRLAAIYLNNTPPEYYRAKITIDKAVKLNPENTDYKNLQTFIGEHLSQHEEREKIGFFRRFLNNLRARF